MNSIKYPEVGWRFNSQEEQFFFWVKKNRFKYYIYESLWGI